jgi:transposase
MLRMIDRHAIQALLTAGHPQAQIAQQLGVSVRTVQRIGAEGEVGSAGDAEARRQRRVGRPGVPEKVQQRLRALMEAEPEAPPLEYLRRLRAEDLQLGDSTFYRLWRREQAQLPVPLMVRFEGVAGEFAQFDFGEVDVRLLADGSRRHLHFAAYRLKYSRWMWVQLVPDERIESLVRVLLQGFEHSGGVPLRVVFDRPRTVVVGYTEPDRRPVWHDALAQLAIDSGFGIELCAPRSPEQKGAVEQLVGLVKRRFFRARRFADVELDVPAQLLEWLGEVNDQRPCRATGVIPAVRLAHEQARMKPLAVPAQDYGLAFPVRVGPTAMVDFEHRRYAMPAPACGLAATLYLYPDRLRIVTAGGRHQVVHPRFPAVGTTSYLPGQRADQLAALHGTRKRLYFMRQRLLELGPAAEAFLTELIHARPNTWQGDVERLFALLEEVGDQAFLQLLQHALLEGLYGAEYVVRLAARQVAS